jgi:hypothetical protein
MVTSLHIKKLMKKKTFLAPSYSKLKLFSKLKNKWLFKVLSKICKTTFSKNTFRCIRKCKNTLRDVTKVENVDKKCLTLSKENEKSPFKHFRFGILKSPVKGLTYFSFRFTRPYPTQYIISWSLNDELY